MTEVEHELEIDKFTLAELEEESELDKLERWHERIAARDGLRAAGSDDAREALGRARQELERYSSAVFERSTP